jgi:arylsulfatase A-like enzyme
LRQDHLGCYGCHRPTSPHIDAIAAEGVRFTNCHASDAPCLPSSTVLFSGLFGIHSGVVNHGGVAAQPFIEGASSTCWQTWAFLMKQRSSFPPITAKTSES